MKSKYTILFIFAFSILTAVHSYAANDTEEKSQKRDVKNFDAIEVSTGIQLFLTMDNTESLRIEASEEIIDDVKSEVKNGTLHLYVKRTGIILFNWRSYSSIKAYVSVKELNRLKASAGAHVKSENLIQGNSLDLDASSGGEIKMELAYKDLTLDASSGAQLYVSGKAKNSEVNTSSGGTIDAGGLESEYCKVSASSGGNVSVHAANEITARASSGGNIRYSGNPKNTDINKSSGGTVSSR